MQLSVMESTPLSDDRATLQPRTVQLVSLYPPALRFVRFRPWRPIGRSPWEPSAQSSGISGAPSVDPSSRAIYKISNKVCHILKRYIFCELYCIYLDHDGDGEPFMPSSEENIRVFLLLNIFGRPRRRPDRRPWFGTNGKYTGGSRFTATIQENRPLPFRTGQEPPHRRQ